MKIEIELPEIEGFEYTGEYGKPSEGEYHYDSIDKTLHQWQGTEKSLGDYHILRKLKPKREFKDGAFYPVIYSSDGVCDIVQYHGGQFDSIHYNICTLGAFSWIGAELVIEWGEG